MNAFEEVFSRLADREIFRRKGVTPETPRKLLSQRIEAVLTDDWQTRKELAARAGVHYRCVEHWHRRATSRFTVRKNRHGKNSTLRHWEYKRKL